MGFLFILIIMLQKQFLGQRRFFFHFALKGLSDEIEICSIVIYGLIFR